MAPEQERAAAQERRQVAAAARRLADRGLLIGTAGNVSVRVGDHVAITGTGVHLDACDDADVTVVDLAGEVVAGSLVPSSELGLHLALYDHDPAARAVVHTHAPASTAVACVLDRLPVLHYQQLSLGGEIRVADYATFGTPELARSVVDAIAGRHAALMANHGSVAVGADLDAAVEHALLLEWLCTLHLDATRLGAPRFLTEEQQLDVIRVAIERKYGTTQQIADGDPAQTRESS